MNLNFIHIDYWKITKEKNQIGINKWKIMYVRYQAFFDFDDFDNIQAYECLECEEICSFSIFISHNQKYTVET